MSADQFDPQWVDDCPSCARHAKELEAAAGERCQECLERFDKPYRQPSPENPALCPSCQAKAVWRATAPKTAGRYGSRGEV